MLSRFGFSLGRNSTSQALVDLGLVPPRRPFERRDFHIDNISPSPRKNELVLVSNINVFCLNIVVGSPTVSGGSTNSMQGKPLVVDNADVLRAMVFSGAPDPLFVQRAQSSG